MGMQVLKRPFALFCAVSFPAIAQAQAVAPVPSAAATPQDTPAAPAATPPDNSGIADIVVTATRREERLQNIPVTVTAIGGDALENSGVREVRSLTQIIPAFNGGRNQNVMQPSIRGVGSAGNSTGDESNVAIYVDGVYQADPYSTQIDLVQVERVEVLRGPQGTVFGRNATGGLVNVITPDPSFTTSGRIAARYGRSREEANDVDVRGYVTGGLGKTVAADLAVLYRKSDGYISDLNTGGTLGAARTISLRSKLMFEPSDSAKILLTAAYVDSKDQVASQQPFRGNTAGAPFPGVIIPDQAWEASLNGRGRSDYNRFDLSLRTQFDLGGVNLETTGAFMTTRVNQYADSDASNILLGYTDMRVRPKTYSQEVRLLSTGVGRFKWILGAYAFRLTGEQPVFIYSAVSPTAVPSQTLLEPKVTTTSFAGFAEGTYEFVDSLFLTGGVRYTTEKRTFEQSVNGTPLPFGTARKSFNKFTYRAALRYNFADHANVYASYGTGFKSGVFNTFGTSPIAVNPESIKAAEIGLKVDPASWLRTNLSAYRYDYSGLQVTARSASNAFILQNAATAKIYGGELEVTVVPIRDLNLRASAVYTHAEYDKFPQAQVFIPKSTGGNIVGSADVSGKWMIRTPRYTFNLGGTYGIDIGKNRLTASANLFHSGKVYYDFLNSLVQNSYTMLSGEIGLRLPGEKISFNLFASNLTNAKVAQQISPGPLGTYIIYERPRRVGIGAEIRF
jgi:iron complex outermembrane recepter protein